MKTLLSYRTLFRILSLSLIPLLIVSDLFMFGLAFSPTLAVSAILSGYLVLVLVPPSRFDPKIPFFVVAGTMAVSALVPSGCRIVFNVTMLLVSVSVVNVILFSDIKKLAPSKLTWPFVQNEARCLSAIVWLSLALLHHSVKDSDSLFVGIGSLLISTVLYLLRYLKDYNDLPYVMKATDSEMMKIIALSSMDNEKAARLFQRIDKMMEEKSLYLDASLSQSNVARMALTNSSYVSKVVNHFSGKNFKNYLSSYRVRHAAELIDKDPRLKMSEVAQMSGFNSVPTFNHMFKDHMGLTPTEYKNRQRPGPH